MEIRKAAVAATILRLGISEVEARTGLSRSTITRKMKRGEFPPGVFIGERRKWDAAEIDGWIDEQASRPVEARRGAANLAVRGQTP